MNVLFTDLDGTLLDPETYSCREARPAIKQVKKLGVPWVFVTSKTRAEVEIWRSRLGNHHPFVVENGAAAFIPRNYFGFPVAGAIQRDNYDVLEWGMPYAHLVHCLLDASRRSQCRVHGFHQMTASEISRACELPLEQAGLAKLREFDEPFRIIDPDRESELLKEIEELKLRWTKGDRFWHITGDNDKAVAVRSLQRLFERAHGRVVTIGLGDALNDARFLQAVKIAVLVRSSESPKLQAAVPHGLLTEHSGPAGWNEAVLNLIGA